MAASRVARARSRVVRVATSPHFNRRAIPTPAINWRNVTRCVTVAILAVARHAMALVHHDDTELMAATDWAIAGTLLDVDGTL